MLRNRSTSMMGGIVASPTPTVPMSGDSITVMTVPVPGRARDNMLAASHPAVPPPTMAMLRIRLSGRVSDIGDQNLASIVQAPTGERPRQPGGGARLNLKVGCAREQGGAVL